MKLFELYQEGKKSTVTHDGKTYSVNKLLKYSEELNDEEIDVDKLKWILDDTEIDKERVKRAKCYPILVTRWKDKLVVLDGAHRLAKAVKDNKSKIKGKLITSDILKRSKIED